MTDFAFPAPNPAWRPRPWGTLASLALHVGLALAVILLSPLRELVAPPPEPVAVEIVSARDFAALQAPPTATPAIAETTDEVAEPVARADDDRLSPSAPLQPDLPETPIVTATEFYSARLLAQPDMAGIRRTMGTLAAGERLVQICNIEALEQIRRGAPEFDPDTLVAYAMSDPMVSGLTLSASGAAFRSRREWYGVAFHCTAAAGYSGVLAFDFKLGDPFPESEWEEHNLNAEDSLVD